MLDTGAFRKQLSSTPIASPECSLEKIGSVAQTALDIIGKCVENGEDVERFYNDSKTAGAGQSPAIQEIINRTREDTKAMIQLKSKIKQLNESVRSGNRNAIKNDIENMISSLEKLSAEKIQMVSDVLCLTETSKVRKKLEATDKIYDTIDLKTLHDKTRLFVKLLRSRNQKVIVCIGEVYNTLKNLLSDKRVVLPAGEPIQSPMNRSQTPKKLYILGENLQQRLDDQYWATLIGNVVIEDLNNSSRSPPRLRNDQQNLEYRHTLSGFLEDDAGNMERVALELSEAVGDFMNFSDDSFESPKKLTARVHLNGQDLEESFPVIEIDLRDEAVNISKEAARVIAIVQNDRTGRTEPVELALVPTSPEKRIHGKILELMSANTEFLADISEPDFSMESPRPQGGQKDESPQQVFWPSNSQLQEDSIIHELAEHVAGNIVNMLTSSQHPTHNQRFLTEGLDEPPAVGSPHYQKLRSPTKPSYEDDLIKFDNTDGGSKNPLWDSIDSFLQHEKEAEEEEERLAWEQTHTSNRQGNNQQLIHDLVEEAADTIVNVLSASTKQNSQTPVSRTNRLPESRRRLSNRKLNVSAARHSTLRSKLMRKTMPASSSRFSMHGQVKDRPIDLTLPRRYQRAPPRFLDDSEIPPPGPEMQALIDQQKAEETLKKRIQAGEIIAIPKKYYPDVSYGLINKILDGHIENYLAQYATPPASPTMNSMRERSPLIQFSPTPNRSLPLNPTPVKNPASRYNPEESFDYAVAKLNEMRDQAKRMAQNLQQEIENVTSEDLDQEELSLVDD